MLGLAALVTLLALVGVVPTWAGLAHHVALPPLDLFADVRVLLAEAPSLAGFVGGLVAVIVLRSLVLAAMLAALDRGGVARAVRFYGAALPVALVVGTLGYAGVVALYSPFLWVAVGVALVAALVLGPGAWRRPARRRGAAGTVAAHVVALVIVSGVGGAAFQVGAVWLIAALTALAARRLGGAAPPGGRSARGGMRARLPRLVGGALAVVLAGATPFVVGGPGVGDGAPPGGDPAVPVGRAGVGRSGDARKPGTAAGTLFLVPGIDGASGTSTLFRLDPGALGFDCEQTAYFSYAGPGSGAPQRAAACPITRGALYVAADTRRPLGELVRSFREQLAELAPPVTVVAHSQGGWVAAAAIRGTAMGEEPAAGVPDPVPVRDLVLIGTFPRHERAYVLGSTGAGVVGTRAMEALMAVLRASGRTTFDPRAPLPRELLGTPGAVADLMAGLPDDLRVATVTSLLDLPVMPRAWGLPGARDLCPVPVAHGAMPVSPAALKPVDAWLAGERPGACPWWRERPAQAFIAFGAPPPR